MIRERASTLRYTYIVCIASVTSHKSTCNIIKHTIYYVLLQATRLFTEKYQHVIYISILKLREIISGVA